MITSVVPTVPTTLTKRELEAEDRATEIEINKYISALDALTKDNISLRNTIEVLETRLEIYKETINIYKDFQNKLSKIR